MVNIENRIVVAVRRVDELTEGSIPIPWGKNPVATVAGVVGIKTPVLELIEYTEIVAS
jgi:hypothetical protein